MRTRLAILASLAWLAACRTSTPDTPEAPLLPEGREQVNAPVAGARDPKETALMEWNGPFSSVTAPETRIITTIAEWRKLWHDIGSPEAPVADLQMYLGVAVFLGQRNTGGYSVKLLDPLTRDGKVVVPFRESAPKGLVFQALTYPYAVRLYPKTGAEIVVEPEQRP